MRQRLGQHFLTNRPVLRKIAQAVSGTGAGQVIEIGPGHGELTEELLRAPGSGNGGGERGRLIAVERDPALAAALRQNFAGRAEVVEGDVLKVLPDLTPSLLSPFCICGNLPYYLTGHLLRLIGELPRRPAACVFTVQKEVAERMAARPPRMNRLAAAVQFWAEPKIIGFISRQDFSPPPEVDSATVLLKTRPDLAVDPARYYRMLRVVFQQPRKTLANNLAVLGTREEVASILRSAGVEGGLRPQDLAIGDIHNLAAAAFPKGSGASDQA